MKMDNSIKTHPKLYHYFRGLTKEQKEQLRKLLQLNSVYMARFFQNTGKMRVEQLAIIIPFMEKVYGPDCIADWNDVYIEPKQVA